MKYCFILPFVLYITGCNTIPQHEPLTTQPSTPGLTIDILAQQSYWTAHYPGPDGILGKTNYRLISQENPAGIERTDPASIDDFITTQTLHLPLHKPVNFMFR